MFNEFAYFPIDALHNGREKFQIIKYCCKTKISNQKRKIKKNLANKKKKKREREREKTKSNKKNKNGIRKYYHHI